jgi:hypothetical protein
MYKMSGECNICGQWGCVEANHKGKKIKITQDDKVDIMWAGVETHTKHIKELGKLVEYLEKRIELLEKRANAQEKIIDITDKELIKKLYKALGEVMGVNGFDEMVEAEDSLKTVPESEGRTIALNAIYALKETYQYLNKENDNGKI